jgi:hypothetical protein
MWRRVVVPGLLGGLAMLLFVLALALHGVLLWTVAGVVMAWRIRPVEA